MPNERFPVRAGESVEAFSQLQKNIVELARTRKIRHQHSKHSFLVHSYWNGFLWFDAEEGLGTNPSHLIIVGQADFRKPWNYVNIGIDANNRVKAAIATSDHPSSNPFVVNGTLIADPDVFGVRYRRLGKDYQQRLTSNALGFTQRVMWYLNDFDPMCKKSGRALVRDGRKFVGQSFDIVLNSPGLVVV